MVGDTNFLPITHTGSANIATTSGNLPPKDVLVCPNIAKSLLSVSKVTKDYPCTFEFDCDAVRVRDKETKQILLLGRNGSEGLYMLNDQQARVFYSSRQTIASDEVWHRRLGHPNPHILQQLSANKAIVITKISKSVCEACQLGKSSRLPFSASSFVSTKPLERIHCDLWGPAPTVSFQGFRYYVILIDNYSRFCWFYPLRMKSDFFSIFVKFQSLVENQFQSKIGIFQCDGGEEFTSKEFVNHLQKHGIQQYISCPYTPQQNGLAERKHRHITELGMSMLFQCKVPSKYWVEAFFTANFLINLLPHTSLNSSQSPYELFHGQSPEYQALRVFGCSCFPTLWDYAHNKFDPKSLKCVFLGYNDKYKGYKCLLPTTRRVFISRHVIFDEQSFPFSDIYQSLHAHGSTPLLAAWQQSFLKRNLSPFAVSEEPVAEGSSGSVCIADPTPPACSHVPLQMVRPENFISAHQQQMVALSPADNETQNIASPSVSTETPTSQVLKSIAQSENSPSPVQTARKDVQYASSPSLIQTVSKDVSSSQQQKNITPSTGVSTSISVNGSQDSDESTSVFKSSDFPPLPSARRQLRYSPALSTVASEGSSECTAGLDPVPIGNSSPSLVHRTDTAAPSQPAKKIATPNQPKHSMVTRSKAGITKPNPKYGLLTHKVKHNELITVTEALKHPGWNNAMHEEINNCSEAHTWSLVPYTSDMHVLVNGFSEPNFMHMEL